MFQSGCVFSTISLGLWFDYFLFDYPYSAGSVQFLFLLKLLNVSPQVRIKNSYNPAHPGTIISDRSLNRSPDRLVTAITIKRGQCLVDVVSTRMLGQHGFLARVCKKIVLSVFLACRDTWYSELWPFTPRSFLSFSFFAIYHVTHFTRNFVLVAYAPYVRVMPLNIKKVFNVFERHQLSVDVVATSEVSVSLTLGADRRDLIDLVAAELR